MHPVARRACTCHYLPRPLPLHTLSLPLPLQAISCALQGELVPVRITEAFNYFLVGEAETDKFAGGRFVDDGANLVLESASH